MSIQRFTDSLWDKVAVATPFMRVCCAQIEMEKQKGPPALCTKTGNSTWF